MEPMKPTAEERIMAVLAHLGCLAQGMGLPLPAILWAEQAGKSRYVAFHCLQAYGYQSLGYTLWMLASLSLALFGYLGLLVVNAIVPLGQDVMDAFLVFLVISVGILLALYSLIGVVAALACALGGDYRYPALGGRLAKYIGYDPASVDAPLDQEHQERFAASMGHFAVLFPLFGLLAPLGFWIGFGKPSRFLRFQSAQAAVYQAVGSLALTVGQVVILLLIFPLVAGAASFGSGPAGEWFVPATLVLALVGLCCLGLFALVGPLYHIFGQWAGLQLLLGRDFHYPLIGSLVEKWLPGPEIVTEQ